jgi:CSLREA domain-containing protein
VVALVLALAGAAPAHADTYTVTTGVDAPDASLANTACAASGSIGCTLRAAIQQANFHAGNDAIILGTRTHTLTIAGRNEDAAATGDLDITGQLTITGAGAANSIIDGGGLDRVFDVQVGANQVTISGVTIRNGDAGAGLTKGGGILAQDSVTLTNSVVSGNKAGEAGGGICTQDTLVLTNSTVQNNMVVSGPGVIGHGGGVDTQIANTTLTNVTITGNSATRGAGVFNDFVMIITNSTISGNIGDLTGGGAKNNATLDLTNVTLYGNTAGAGSNIQTVGAVTARHTIVANGVSGANCDTLSGTGTFESFGNNLDTGNTCNFHAAGDQFNTPAGLGPLQNNGGPTATHALSPAARRSRRRHDLPERDRSARQPAAVRRRRERHRPV